MANSNPHFANRRCSGIRIAIRVTTGPSIVSRRSMRPTKFSKTPTSAQPTTVSGTPHSSTAAAGHGPRLQRRFRDDLLRYLRRSLRHGRPSRPWLRARARRRLALQYGNFPAGSFCRQGRANSHPDIGYLRGVLRHRRQARHQAEGLLAMRRTGKSPSCAGLFHARTHLSELSRPWPGHREPVRVRARAPDASCASGRCR